MAMGEDLDNDDFRAKLASMNYAITEIEGGVDNLYMAVTTFLYGSPARHREVEAHIRHFMLANEATYAYYVDINGTRRRRPEVEFWLPRGGWNQNSTMVATSMLYEVVIEVVDSDSGHFYQYPQSGGYDLIMTMSMNDDGDFNLLTKVPTQAADEIEQK